MFGRQVLEVSTTVEISFCFESATGEPFETGNDLETALEVDMEFRRPENKGLLNIQTVAYFIPEFQY